MSQARLLACASRRVLERSAARQINYNQHRYLSELSSLHDVYGATDIRSRSRGGHSKSGLHVVNPSAFRSARTLSTNTPQTSTSAKSSDPPPPAKSGKKAKVELRPGPAKTSANGANAKPDSGTTSHPQSTASQTFLDDKPHPTKPPPLATSSPKKAILKDEEGKSTVEIAKKDITEAARHGILKPPPADAGGIGRLFHQAKELFKFYVAGLKYIYVHRKEVRQIQERVKGGGAPLSWREHRFILTNKSDMVKLVPFLIVVIVIEELIPLIVLYVPGMLPSTCVLPSQRERIEARRHERQRDAYALAKATNAFKDANIDGVKLNALDSGDVGLLCSTVGISSWGPLFIQRSRLRRYLLKIAIEDDLLLAEGKGAKLNKAEIATALTDRGFLADSYAPPQQRDRLRWWLENVKVDKTDSQKSPEDIRTELLALMLREASP